MASRAGVFSSRLLSALAMLAWLPVSADAGLPRGAMLVADEQDADPETGITIARGNAEITVDKQRIVGRADSIELRPATKDIVFRGRARVTVGSANYEGDTVTCASDFSRCATGATADATQIDAAATPSATIPTATVPSATVSAAPLASGQTVQQPSALGAGAEVTSPR